MSNLKINKFFLFFFSVLYGCVFSFLPNVFFRDRGSYLVYARDSGAIFDRYYDNGIVVLLSNEPLFLKINHLLSSIFPYEYIPHILVFFSCSIIFYFAMKECDNFLSKFLMLCLMLFTPVFFHLQNVVIRQALCSAILLMICSVFPDRKKWWGVSVFLGFIHSSFFLVAVFLFFNDLLHRYKASLLIRVSIFVVVSIVISLSVIMIGEYFGVRQVSEDHIKNSAGVSGLAFLMWLSVFIVIYLRPKEFINNYHLNEIAIIGLVVYLSMYFLSPVAGRLLITFSPFIFICLVKRLSYLDAVFVFIFLFVNASIFRDSISKDSLLFVIPEFF
ncbi:hypothetical protein PEC301879_13210 [Pectobacterium carotovorum subsp. carotovorum]|nr:hypothetical protein PEC301879_13210 [Pectobacterium carotovorum subsp. carotovorum]